MAQLILGLLYALVDIARAAVDIVCLRRHGRYSASATVRAPLEAVWSLLERRDVTYAVNDMRVIAEPLDGHPEVWRARIQLGGRDATSIAYRYLDVAKPSHMTIRYLPEHSAAAATMGRDDDIRIDLAVLDAGRTRVTYTRALEHVRAGTRISAPLGVRQAMYLTRTQAEHEAGVKAARAPLWHQLVWTLLAFASFAWLLDWRLAIALMLIIAIHEGGHALAMHWHGLGVSVVSFVPFLGGVAAPKRPYQSEIQRIVIALMGVGFSLPLTLALIWLADRQDLPNLAMFATFSVIINGLNLVPFPALDGSVVASILLSKLHKALSQAATILMFGLFVAAGIMLREPMIWVAIALSFISVVQVMSLRVDEHLVRMGRLATAVTLLVFAGLIVAHILAFRWASTTAIASEGRLLSKCLAETGRSPEALRTCRERSRFWLLQGT